jgi:acyl-CoA dehydrogenase
MDFSLSPAQLDLQQRTRSFIADEVIPLESDPRQGSHGPSEELRNELVARARRHGLLTPHASREMGGLGLSHIDKAVVFEEAGYSPLGPVALNIHAPDEGNVHLMERSPPRAEGALAAAAGGRSVPLVLCMTEPRRAPARTLHAAHDSGQGRR